MVKGSSGSTGSIMGTRALAENQIKDYISALVASKKTEAQLQSAIKAINQKSCDLCIAFIKRREREARASNRETQIKGLIEVHNVSNFAFDICRQTVKISVKILTDFLASDRWQSKQMKLFVGPDQQKFLQRLLLLLQINRFMRMNFQVRKTRKAMIREMLQRQKKFLLMLGPEIQKLKRMVETLLQIQREIQTFLRCLKRAELLREKNIP
jgi:hypothetical protein